MLKSVVQFQKSLLAVPSLVRQAVFLKIRRIICSFIFKFYLQVQGQLHILHAEIAKYYLSNLSSCYLKANSTISNHEVQYGEIRPDKNFQNIRQSKKLKNDRFCNFIMLSFIKKLEVYIKMAKQIKINV